MASRPSPGRQVRSRPRYIWELAQKYLANWPFNKQSTKDLHEQIVKNLLVPQWGDAEAIHIDPPRLKPWLMEFNVESSTRGKYKSIMSGVYSWGQCESLIPRGEQFNPCRYVKRARVLAGDRL